MIILVINPGSTSTKVALFRDSEKISGENINHSAKMLSGFFRVIDQLEFRSNEITEYLEKSNINTSEISAIAGRGGLMKPLESGVYTISKSMLEDLETGRFGEHA